MYRLNSQLTVNFFLYPPKGNFYVPLITKIPEWGTGKLCDLKFIRASRVHLNKFFILNVQMQKLLLKWSSKAGEHAEKSGVFLDYSKLEFLRTLNKDLLRQKTDSELLEQLSSNANLAQEIYNEILWKAKDEMPELKEVQNCHPLQTAHLQSCFAPLFQ